MPHKLCKTSARFAQPFGDHYRRTQGVGLHHPPPLAPLHGRGLKRCARYGVDECFWARYDRITATGLRDKPLSRVILTRSLSAVGHGVNMKMCTPMLCAKPGCD